MDFLNQINFLIDIISNSEEFNTAFLIYNLEYDAKKIKNKSKNNELKFIGVAQ